MRIVIDSNRVVASLLKNSTTREILYNRHFDFVAPEFIKEEIMKYKRQFIQKARITTEEFDILLSLLFQRITVVPRGEYAKHLKQWEKKIADFKDIPYLACCISAQAEGIWSHDPDFLEQDKIRIFTNKNLLDISRS